MSEPTSTSTDSLGMGSEHATGRALGFMGEPAVTGLELSLALDKG